MTTIRGEKGSVGLSCSTTLDPKHPQTKCHVTIMGDVDELRTEFNVDYPVNLDTTSRDKVEAFLDALLDKLAPYVDQLEANFKAETESRAIGSKAVIYAATREYAHQLESLEF